MKNFSGFFQFLAILSIAVLPLGASLQAAEADSIEGLTKVKSKKFDTVYLLNEADFSPYTKVMIDDPEVAFDRNWIRDYNSSVGSTSSRLSSADAQRILDEARDGVSEVYAGEFSKAGYDIVAAPGPDVLRLRIGVVNLRINAPDTMSPGRSRSYSRETGRATLILEARDSTSGALLGQAVDSRTIGDSSYIQVRNGVSNRSDFAREFKRWAQLSVKALDELKALNSPDAGKE